MISKDNTLDRKVLAILIALEAVLFCNFYFREIAWYPPLHIDQSGFLTQTYQLEELMPNRERGLELLRRPALKFGAIGIGIRRRRTIFDSSKSESVGSEQLGISEKALRLHCRLLVTK
jgi:hypothetical protein